MISEATTSPRVHRDEILKRTFSSAKWMLYLSASALIAGFGTNVILGRMGPEVLGLYSLLMLVVSMIQTFFVFGAANVLIQYIPGLSLEVRPKFIYTYSAIVFAAGFFSLAVCLAFPSIMQFVFRQELHVPVGMYMTVLVPPLLALVLVWGILQAELEGVGLAISQNSVSWFYCVGIGTLWVLGLLNSGSQSGMYIFAAVVLSNIVALLIGLRYLSREYLRVQKSETPWFLPAGFWKFTLALHFGTLFNFMIANAAPVFILRELGLRELGYFRAASVFAGFVSWIPGVFDKSFYPSFANLVSTKHSTDDVYLRFSRLSAMSSGIVAVVILLFTRELLSIFGKDFSDGAYFLLVMLAAGYVMSTPFIQINFALVTAHMKTPHTMGAYAIGAASGILLYSTLVPRFGLEGIALSFILLQVVLFLLSWGLTWYFTRSPFPWRAYLVTISVVVAGFTGAYWWGTVSVEHILMKLALLLLLMAFLGATKLVTKPELRDLVSLLFPQLSREPG